MSKSENIDGAESRGRVREKEDEENEREGGRGGLSVARSKRGFRAG